MKRIESVLFAGLGGIGQRHLRNLWNLTGGDIKVYAYRKRNRQIILNDRLEIEQDQGLSSKYGIICVDSLEEAFRQGVRTVFICNPTIMHMDVLIKALEAGCDVFIEKPVSSDLERMEEAEKLINRNKNKVFVGYQNRFHPCIIKAKKLIEQRAVGDIISIHAEIGESVKGWHKYEDYRDMYACRKDLGGGVVVTQIHELDYLYHLFGMPETVYAVGGRLSDLDIDVEDAVHILMGYKISGRYIPVSVYEDYIQNPAKRVCSIVGTKGKIEIDLISAVFVLYDENGTVREHEKFPFERNDMFLKETAEFLTCIENGSDPAISFQEGRKSLEIAMAARKSMTERKIVKLADFLRKAERK